MRIIFSEESVNAAAEEAERGHQADEYRFLKCLRGDATESCQSGGTRQLFAQPPGPLARRPGAAVDSPPFQQ